MLFSSNTNTDSLIISSHRLGHIHNMTRIKERRINRIRFLSGQVTALKEAVHTDVMVKPGDNGPGIPAHKAVLALKSKVFRNMLDCKLSPGESITIPDLNYKELETLLEFFYTGKLNRKSKHIRALYLAADKYDIQYLQDVCRRLLISSFNLDNFYDIFELSNDFSDAKLKKSAIDFATENFRDVINSKRSESFHVKNPMLGLEIVRACVKE